jgi:iron complex outermembrane receptor protein
MVCNTAQAEERRFDIPVQSANSAVSELARQSGLQIIAPAELLDGKQTPEIRGVMDSRAALRLFINGMGLEIASDADGTIVLRARSAQPKPRKAPPQGQATDSGEVESVTVTAQKRDERAQRVPITLSAFSAARIEAFKIESLRDVGRFAPGLLVSSFNMASPTIAIRGASNTFTQIGANKPVAVVVDDVFVPRNSAATFELYELTSVQVLKGPQGTLFGRNVTGGAVVLDTGKPSFETFASSVQIETGNFDLIHASGRVDIPLGEALEARLVGNYKDHGGYGRDRINGQAEDNQNSTNFRGQLRSQINDPIEVLVSADYSKDENGGRTLSAKNIASDGDRRTSELGIPQNFNREIWGTSARINWMGDAGAVSSITAYRKSFSGENYSSSSIWFGYLAGSQSQVTNKDNDRVGSFSQEFRYASPKWNFGDFVSGVYYSNDDAKRQLYTINLAGIRGNPTSYILSDQSVKASSYAGFADGNLHITDKITLTVGGRYTRDEKTADQIRTDYIRPANNYAVYGLNKSWGQFSPRVVSSWSPTEDLLFFAGITRGYTAGGFNTDAATTVALRTPFSPEKLTNYELGAKTQWLDGHLRANASLFHMDYTDKQELFFNTLTGILNITNAAKATMEGVEAEFDYRPTGWLSLNATYGLLSTVYNTFVIPGGAVYTGNRLSSSPRNKGSLSANVHQDIDNFGMLFGTVSYSYTGNYYTGAARDPNLHIGAYGLGNASIGWTSTSDRYQVTLWAKNITDTAYVLTPSSQSGVLGEYLGEPRTFGITAKARF